MNDGGPAFPTDRERYMNPGLSIRDWFAGMATDADVDTYTKKTIGGIPIITRAEARYSFADAMLAEREKGGENG